MNVVPAWWKNAVCYQIYPRSFADGNGDGIGDVKGIIQKLDYLSWLGINVIWISPLYPSPNFDWGYDISDYCDIDPDYGTLEEFDRLILEAHQRGIRVLMDLVLNHTSNQHPWFQSAISSPHSPYRDFYVWQKGKNGNLPNDWESVFGGSAWTLDEASGEYYYHLFYKEQPDLNWRNPAVKQAMFDSIRFWLERGVDGFRMDAIGCIYETVGFPDHQVEISLEELSLDNSLGITHEDETLFERKLRHQINLPEVHDLLREIRQLVDVYGDRILLGEVEETEYYGTQPDELHSVFNFPIILKERLNAQKLRKVLTERAKKLPHWAWECNTIGNHDRTRSYSYYADGRHDQERARLALAMVSFLRGTPVFYNGEEIGMSNFRPEKVADFLDIVAVNFYQTLRQKRGLSHQEAFEFVLEHTCRDRCRTPLQWDNTPNAGFSPEGIKPWLPVNPDYRDGVNVEDQIEDEDSMLSFLRTMIRLRAENPALIDGEFEILPEPGDLFAFLRRVDQQEILVLLNMSETNLTWINPYPNKKVLYSSVPWEESGPQIVLQPYHILLIEVIPDEQSTKVEEK